MPPDADLFIGIVSLLQGRKDFSCGRVHPQAWPQSRSGGGRQASIMILASARSPDRAGATARVSRHFSFRCGVAIPAKIAR